jgi:hypothetical protein
MHIIFGEAVKEIPDSFTVLELDTFNLGENKTATAYCVVEKIPLAEFQTLSANKDLHSNLIKYYREKKWNYCEQAIEALIGKWNGELDSFYTDLHLRISELKNNKVDDTWDGILLKN